MRHQMPAHVSKDTSTDIATHDVTNQAPAYGDVNLYQTDPVLQACVSGHVGEGGRDELSDHGAKAGSAAFLERGRLANRFPPELKTHDRQGRRLDQVEFHAAYHDLMADAVSDGLHCALLEGGGPGAQLGRAAKFFLTSQAETGHTCPITMTNAAAAVMNKYPEPVEAFLPLMRTRRYDPRFLPIVEKSGITIGMGMTEKQGGTDLRAISSTAEAGNDGYHSLTGHKWFFSAPMCDAFLVLAKTAAGPSCFLMPRILPDGRVNGLRFQRLKDKLGNTSNASSEVEFHRAAGILIGEEGRGIATIIDMVTPTRIDCALGSAAQMRASVARAVHHCRHRTAFGHKLIDQPLMSAVLADLALEAGAAAALAFRLVDAAARAEVDETAAAYARLMTPAVKYWICKTAPALTYEAMECLGGNGYVEDFDMARIYRDAPVNAIWEGSGNVMALDVLRALSRHPEALDLVLNDLSGADAPGLSDACEDLRKLAPDALHDHRQARAFTERLALAGAASAFAKVARDPDIARTFADTRLSGRWRSTYGQLPAGFAARPAIDALYPVG